MQWTDLKEDKYSKRYFARLDSLDEFKSAIEASVELLNIKGEFDLIMVRFECETSLIYIYPFKECDLDTEVEVKITIQLVPFFDYFESVESRWYKFGN